MSSAAKPETLLITNETEDECDNRSIWDRARSKRRRTELLSLSKVSKIFPDLETKLLCQLSEMVDCTPLEIKELILEATTKQLCAFFDLIEAKAAHKSDSRREQSGLKSGKAKSNSLLDQLRHLDEQRVINRPC